MEKEQMLSRLNKEDFYKDLVPSLKINGKPEVLGLCPFHDDHNPSLSVNLETGLFRCFACDAKGDLFTFYQKFKDLDFPTTLQEIGAMVGVADTNIKPKVVATFKYTDEAGNLRYTKRRIEPGFNGRSKKFVFKHLEGDKWVANRGCDPVLYNLPGVIKSKNVIVAEGEAKADLLNSWGLTATCLDSGANSPWRDEYLKVFEDKEKVVILPDSDDPGRAYASKIANALHGKVNELKVVELPGLSASEDVIDWARIADNNKEKLIEIVKNVPLWTPKAITEVTVTPEDEIQILDFPIDVFPTLLKKLVLDVSKAVGIPSSVTGSVVLTTLSTAIGNAIRISPKPAFEVPPFLWAGVVMPTGSAKTPAVEFFIKPVNLKQAAAYKRYKNEVKQHQLELRAFKKNETDEIPNEPILEQYIVQDSTVEALSTAFEFQPRGLLSIQDELSGWLLGMNQYKGSGNDRQAYLQLFNAGSWSINRKSGIKFIPSTGLGIIGNIQPEMIPLIFENKSFADGLI